MFASMRWSYGAINDHAVLAKGASSYIIACENAQPQATEI